MITQITKMIIQPSLAFRRDPAEVINEGGTVMDREDPGVNHRNYIGNNKYILHRTEK
jgi:hypothetical protein